MFYKKLLAATVGISLAASAIGATNMQIIKKDNNPLGNKPYTEISISANGACDYQILINDVPIYSDTGAINTTLPVNQYMINGDNNLSLTIQDKDINCSVSATLQVRHADDFNSSKDISTISFDGNPSKPDKKDISKSSPVEKLTYKDNKFIKSDDGYINISQAKLETGKVYYGYNYDNQKREDMAGVKVSQDIILPIDIPHWAWLDGEKIENNQETKDQLIAIYKTIWKLIQDKDWDKLNKMFALRDKEMGEALYGEPNTVTNLESSSKDKNLVTINTKTSNKVMFSNEFGDSKFITLTGWNGAGVLIFNKDGSTTYNITFAKINGVFVIIR